MKAIIAINNKGFIGKNGQMLWRSSEDFKHFKKMTIGEGINILIVGKTTFENDLQCKELINRTMLVVGTNYHTLPHAVRCAYSHQSLMGECTTAHSDIWVIGGSSIYNQLLPLISEFHISHIDDDQEGDTSFELPSNFRGKVFHYNFSPNKPKE